jgi:Fe-S cluster assembly protein SufD
MKTEFSPNEWYLAQFAAFEKTLNGESKSSVHSLRREAMDKFHGVGFPTARNEEWRFTSVAPIAKIEFRPVLRLESSGVTTADVGKFALETKHLLVFVNGHFAPDLSIVGALPQGVLCMSLASAVRSYDSNILKHLARQVKIDETPFVSLNTAFLQDGAFIFVPDGIDLQYPIHLLFVASEKNHSLISPRNLVIVGKRSRASIVESYVSLDDHSYLTNAVTEVVAGEESVLEHDKLQNESLRAFHVAMIQARLGERAKFTSNSIAAGGSIVRNNV